MSKLLIDTNVLVYLKDTSSAFHRASVKLFKGNDQFYTTSKNLSEYYAVVTKGEKPLLTPQEALHDITEFALYCTILFPSYLSYQKLSELIKKYHPKGLRVHDFEIASIALVNNVLNVATFNRSDFQQITGIEVTVPVL
ncbi:MAG: PIN domain-containing protein [Cyclobacteriaceae bacterium]|nr:PIN domain-containing protein [Cyclobacteriaceae bacterium]